MADKRHSLTLTLCAAIVTLCKVDSLSVTYYSSRKADDPRDGMARKALMRALCAAICAAGEAGRNFLRSVIDSNPESVMLMMLMAENKLDSKGKAYNPMWSAPHAAYEAQLSWQTGKALRPDAQPDCRGDAAAALISWERAEEARKVKAGQAAAAVPAAVHTCAEPPADKPSKGSKGKGSKPSKA